MRGKYTLAVVFSLVLAGCAGISQHFQPGDSRADSENPNVTMVEKIDTIAATATDSVQSEPESELLLDQAKIQYSNALISVYDNDTTGARFHFESALEYLRQLQDYENLTPWVEDESILFTQKITEDYVHYIENKQENVSGYVPSSLQEQISLLEPIEEIEWENGQFQVLDDREGHIPIILNARVEQIIRFLQTTRHNEFQTYLNRINKFEDMFKGILAEYNLPPELFYLSLIESGLNPKAYSYAYAAGPWQFIYSTGRNYGLERTWYMDERYDPIKSTHAAARFLSKLYEEFGDWYLAMAAYNSGERRIWRAIQREGTRNFWNLSTLPRQTRNYVPTILAATIIAHHPEEYGFTIEPEPVWAADTVHIDSGYEFSRIASALSVSVATLRELNPEIRQDITPTNVDRYILRLPSGTKDRFLAAMDDLPEAGEREYATHYVRYGETLSLIARTYSVSVQSIMSVNNLQSSHWIRVGQRLTIPLSPSYATSRRTTTSSSSSNSIPQDVPGRRRIVYIVKSGDTLGEIAEIYQIRAQQIRDWNGLYYGQYIYPGDRLNIWVPEDSELTANPSDDSQVASTQPTQDGEFQIYVVQSRDTLWDIARRYGVELNELRQWNPDVANGDIQPGDRIRIAVN